MSFRLLATLAIMVPSFAAASPVVDIFDADMNYVRTLDWGDGHATKVGDIQVASNGDVWVTTNGSTWSGSSCGNLGRILRIDPTDGSILDSTSAGLRSFGSIILKPGGGFYVTATPNCTTFTNGRTVYSFDSSFELQATSDVFDDGIKDIVMMGDGLAVLTDGDVQFVDAVTLQPAGTSEVTDYVTSLVYSESSGDLYHVHPFLLQQFDAEGTLQRSIDYDQTGSDMTGSGGAIINGIGTPVWSMSSRYDLDFVELDAESFAVQSRTRVQLSRNDARATATDSDDFLYVASTGPVSFDTLHTTVRPDEGGATASLGVYFVTPDDLPASSTLYVSADRGLDASGLQSNDVVSLVGIPGEASLRTFNSSLDSSFQISWSGGEIEAGTEVAFLIRNIPIPFDATQVPFRLLAREPSAGTMVPNIEFKGHASFQQVPECPSGFNTVDHNNDGVLDICAHPTAVVSSSATLAPGVTIGANATVGDNANIGIDVSVGAGSYVGRRANIGDFATIGDSTIISDKVTVGNDSEIGGNVVIGSRTNIGNNTVVGDGTVIGRAARVDIYTVIGTDCTISREATVGRDVVLGAFSTVGYAATLGNSANIDGPLALGSLSLFGNLNSKFRRDYAIQIDGSLVVGRNTTLAPERDQAFIVNGDATIGPNTVISAPAELDDGARIRKDVTISAQLYAGRNSRIGRGARLEDQTYLEHNTTIGSDVRLCSPTYAASDIAPRYTQPECD